MNYTLYFIVFDWYAGAIALGFITGIIIAVLDILFNRYKKI